MIGNEIARRTSFIHRAANLRDIIGLLWRYAPYTFRIWLDLLPVLFFFGDFLRGRRKLAQCPLVKAHSPLDTLYPEACKRK